jgi:predicted acyltransferase
VFPAFLMLVGVSIPLALSRAKATTGLNGDQARRIFWRTARLIVFGLVLTNLEWFAAMAETPWAVWDVLQRIGLVYGVCAVLFFRCEPRTLAWIVAGLLLLYWPVTLIPALDGLPNNLWLRGHNFVSSVDRVMLGAGNHTWVKGPEGYDPEGLVGTLPAIAHGLIGVLVGGFILKQSGRNFARRLAVAGTLMLAAGIGWGFFFPVIKDIWSSSFVLVTCGITMLALALLQALFERGKGSEGGHGLLVNIPLAFGLNAIAAYVLHDLAAPMLGWQLTLAPFHWLKPHLGEPTAALVPVILFIIFIWLCMDYLRRRNWIIKI